MKNTTQHSTIYKQAEDQVRRLVIQKAGQRLPSERELAQDLRISRPRLRSILSALRTEGLIEQRPGSGTYALAPDNERLNRVAVLIDEGLKLRDDPFISHLFECLQDSLQEEGARCMIERVDASDTSYRLEDGAITLGLVGHRVVEELRPADPPVVGLLLGPNVRPGRRASIFLLEDRDAGANAARFLLDKGCKQLFFLGRTDIPASNERYEGVRSILEGTNVSLNFISTHLNYAAGLKLGLDWSVPDTDGPVGIIVTNDWLAVGLRAGLRSHGTEKSNHYIVSFDGLPMTADPALDINSLVIPVQAIAKDAVMELRNLSRSPISVGRVVRYPLAWRSRSDIADYK
jgi:DNA-binding LacI/PurR family transcriptional regulator